MSESLWRRCIYCSALVTDESGICYGTNHHSTQREQFVVLRRDEPAAAGQHGWRECTKCRALVFGTGGFCPSTRGAHVPDASDYAVIHDPSADPSLGAGVVGHQGWRWCSKCHALYRPSGTCPAGQQHGADPSGHYAVPTSAQALVIRTPVRRVTLATSTLSFHFDWATAPGHDGTALTAGQGAWVARAPGASGPTQMKCHLDLGGGAAPYDLDQRRVVLTQLNAHLFTPGLLLELIAFDWPGGPTWDADAPEIGIRRLA